MRPFKTVHMIIASLSLLKLGIHIWANGHYGFHRDELLHIACGEHLDWGYMEFPPWIAWMAALSRLLFGESVLAIRIFPALIGSVTVWIVVMMAKELKGGVFAQILAATCWVTATAYYRSNTLFQPVVFDQFFWTLGYLFFLKYLNTQESRFLIFMGVIAGFGLLNKYTMLFWGAGLVLSVLLVSERRIFRAYPIWLAGMIALLLFTPNIIWQLQQGFPVLGHFSGLYADHFQDYSSLSFLIHQLEALGPLTFPIWLLGIFYLITSQKYRVFGFIYITTLALFLFSKGKSYYLFAIYPIYFAAGAVFWEKIIQKNASLSYAWVIHRLVPILLLIQGMLAMPLGTPFLPIESFVAYAQIPRDEAGRLQGLTGDYADMFGWEEQVALIDSIYQTLSLEEQSSCMLWAENYGEAGAIQVLGAKYNLPPPVCSHGSFYLWGVPIDRAKVAITLGLENKSFLKKYYEEVKLAKVILHPYAIDEEHNIPVYICRDPKRSLKSDWPKFRKYVFN